MLDAEGYNKQGDDFFDAGQYDKAAQSYQEAIRQRPDYADAYHNLGNALTDQSRFDAAIAAYRKLSVNSRGAAVDRALVLGLIDNSNVTALEHGRRGRPTA